jgi:lysine/ornithine N-monooxygenase
VHKYFIEFSNDPIKNNYIIQNVHFLIMNKAYFLHHYISSHFISTIYLCMHVLKLTLILHLVVFTAATTLLQNCVSKQYRISFADSCIGYSLIPVKLIFPSNIQTTDKKGHFPQYAVKIKTRAEISWCVADCKPSPM